MISDYDKIEYGGVWRSVIPGASIKDKDVDGAVQVKLITEDNNTNPSHFNQFIHLCIRPLIYQIIHSSNHPNQSQSVYPSIHPFIHLSIPSQSLHLSINSSIHLSSICPAIIHLSSYYSSVQLLSIHPLFH